MHLSTGRADDAARNRGKTQKKAEHGDGTRLKNTVATGAAEEIERADRDQREEERQKRKREREREDREANGGMLDGAIVP